MKKRTRTILLCSFILLVAAISGLSIWFLTRDKETTKTGNALDIAWYDENGTEFTITTAEQLFDLVKLSKKYDFKGQTIKLGADIVVNEGDAADWELGFAENMWKPIEGFAGTFDGQGHSISGVCGKDYGYSIDGSNVVQSPMGLFVDTKKDCVIKDFKLLNSYFCSDASGGIGSIVGFGVGTLENIYSDAIVVGYSNNNGGIIGMISGTGSATITNCWFDGEVRVDGNVGRYTGGIAGRVTPTNGQNKIEHCLNTGSVSAVVTGKGVNMAGIIGNVQDSARVNLSDCLNVGQISNEYGAAVGSVIGSVEANASVNIADVFTQSDTYRAIIGNVSGSILGAPIGNSLAKLTGFESVRWTTLNFDEYWAVVEDGTPVLQYFADEDPSVAGIEKGYNTSWYDKSKNEFTLTTLEQFYGFAYLSYETNFSGKTVKLGADLVVNEGTAKDWLNGAKTNEWLTIGAYGFPFVGTFDGQMHTISGIYLNESRSSVGVFGSTGENATVKNLKLTNSYINVTGRNVGSIAGNGGGTFDTIYSNATVIGATGNVGGLIGATASTGVTMTNCWFDGSVTGTGNTKANRITGGLVGIVSGASSISNCLNTGVVDASAYTFNQGSEKNKLIVPVVGGLVGNVAGGKILTLKESLNAGEVKTSDVVTTGYGSVIGYVNGTAEVTYVYATAESCSILYAGNKPSGSIVSMAASDISGYEGYQWTLLDFANYWSVVMTDTPILKSFAASSPSVSGVARMVDDSWYDETKDTYILYDAADLNGFALLASGNNFKGKTVKLGKDIVLNTGDASTWGENAPSNPWTAIGSHKLPFAGTFDGQMHTISGLYMSATAGNSGLFGRVGVEGVVKNVKLTNSYLESTTGDFGSIAGVLQGTLDTVYSDAIVLGKSQRTGGLVGHTSTGDAVIRNCWFDGSLTNTGTTTSSRQNGGIVGYVYSGSLKLSNCLNTGTITSMFDGKLPVVGGMIGEVAKASTLKTEGCLNVGKVVYSEKGTNGIGPIVGWNNGQNNTTLTTTYGTAESCSVFDKSAVSGITKVTTANITGYLGYQWTLLDFDKYWAVVLDGTPVLKSFAKEVPSLAGVERMIDISWYDTKKDTYILYDAADLNGFASISATTDFAGKTVKLGKDIVINQGDASTWGESAPSILWTPISAGNKPFAGTFDGNMHSISGIYMDASQANSGLFSATSKTAVIKNLKLTNSYMKTSALTIGSIAGVGRGTFDTIYSDAIVESSNGYVAGMVGATSADAETVMINCWFDGAVTSTGNSMGCRRTAGLIAYAQGDATITNCLNTGTIDASTYTYNQSNTGKLVLPLVGGLVGNVASKKTLTVSDSLNAGTVKYSSSATSGYGSLAGYLDGAMVASNAYATSESCKATTNGGTVSGMVYKKNEAEITGYLGYQWTLLDFDTYWAVVRDDTPVLKSFTTDVPSLAGIDKMIDTSWYDEDESTYTLEDKADLYGFAMLFDEADNYKGKTIKLAKDIVVNEGNAADWATEAPAYSWNPVGYREASGAFQSFEGTFDGQGHTISGLYLKTDTRFSGLFGATGTGATVKNLKLKNSYFESSAADFGSVVGLGNGTFDTIYTDAIVVVNNARVGGMIGQINDTTTIKNCWFDGTLTNKHASATGMGGIAGFLYTGTTAMENCLNTGTIDLSAYKGTNPQAGGLMGSVNADATLNISKCLNTGSVYNTTATAGLGPVVGLKSGKGTVSELYATTQSCTNNKSTVSVTTCSLSDIIGDKAETKLSALDFDATWTTVDYTIPVLKEFKKEMIDVSWYNEDKDIYQLEDRADFYGFSVLCRETDFAGKTILLAADIVMNNGSADKWGSFAPNRQWLTIGTATQNSSYKDTLTKPFNGTFNGQGYTISGIYVSASGSMYQGLFGATGEAATLKNFRMVNSYIYGSHVTGAVAGAGNGIFENIYADVIVKSTGSCVGGLIGRNYNAAITMKNCWNVGDVSTTRTASNPKTGGLVGLVGVASRFTDCLNTGSVTATGHVTTNVAGLVGYAEKDVTITDSLNTGKVTYKSGATSGFGALVGTVHSSALVKIYTSYADASTCGKAVGTADKYEVYDNAGAKVDVSKADSTVMIQKTAMSGANAMNALKGFDFTNTWEVVLGDAPVLKAFKDALGESLMDISWYDESATEYTLYNKADLFGFASLVNAGTTFTGKTVKLGANITIQDGDASKWASSAPNLSWTPIGTATQNSSYKDDLVNPFNGTFDGQDHTISGIYINAGSSMYQGLFGATGKDAVLKNFRLENSYIRGQHVVGSIAGAGNGTFENIYTNAIVVGNGTCIGGLVGRNYIGGITMKNCWSDGSVTTTRTGTYPKIGGLIGLLGYDSTITDCLNTSAIDSTACALNNGLTSTGGLVGLVEGKKLTITDSLNLGTIAYRTGTTNGYGSLVGNISGTGHVTVYSSYADASVSDKVFGATLYTLYDAENKVITDENALRVTKGSITGDAAKATLKGFDFKTVWKTVADGTPILAEFQ